MWIWAFWQASNFFLRVPFFLILADQKIIICMGVGLPTGLPGPSLAPLRPPGGTRGPMQPQGTLGTSWRPPGLRLTPHLGMLPSRLWWICRLHLGPEWFSAVSISSCGAPCHAWIHFGIVPARQLAPIGCRYRSHHFGVLVEPQK